MLVFDDELLRLGNERHPVRFWEVFGIAACFKDKREVFDDRCGVVAVAKRAAWATVMYSSSTQPRHLPRRPLP